MSISENISAKVSKLRERLGLSQEQFAEKLGGYSRNYVSMVEGGRQPGRSFLQALTRLEREVLADGEQKSEQYGEWSDHALASGPRGRLQAAVRSRGLSPAQVARLMGFDTGVVANVLEGTGRASERMIEAFILEFPELTKEELMEGADQPPVLAEDGLSGTHGALPNIALPPGMKGRMVPLLSSAQAGGWDAWHSDTGWAGEAVFALNVDDRRAFAIKVSGNSMEPDIHEGDVVICSPGVQITPGCCAVVRTKSEQAFIKFWRSKGDMVTLESANPAYKAIELPLAEIAGAWPVVQRIASGLIKRA